MTSTSLFPFGTLKKFSIRNCLQIVIFDACDPWHAMCFSVFAIISIDIIRNRYKYGNKKEADRRFKAQKTEKSS